MNDTNMNDTNPIDSNGTAEPALTTQAEPPQKNPPLPEVEKTAIQAENQAFSAEKLVENEPENHETALINLDEDLDPFRVTSDGRPSPLDWPARSPLDYLLTGAEADWLAKLLDENTYKTVKQIIAQPRPHGLGVQTSIASLCRFYQRHRSEDLDAQQDILRQQVDHILVYVGNDDENFTTATKHLLKRKLVEAVISPHTDTKEIAALHAILDRMKHTELAERRLQLAEQQANNKS